MDISSNAYLMNRFMQEGIEFKEREVYREIKKKSLHNMIITLSGMRRVGKTHILKKYLHDNKEKAFYYSFDEEPFPGRKELNEVIEYAVFKGKKIIGLDEVQKIENWAGVVKKYYDNYKGIKFVISGSSSLYLKSGNESLAGRAMDFKVFPLSFNEYIDFTKTVNLNRYIKTGFPEIVLKDIDVKNYMKSIIYKVIEYDIPKLYAIKKPYLMEELLLLLSERAGKEVEYRSLGDELGISKDTVKEYLRIIENSYLINIVYPYTGRKSSSIRKMKKVYFSFPSISLALEPLGRGESIEHIVFHHLRMKGEVYFWKYKANEVDFVFKGKRVVPVEVKAGSVSKSDAKTLRKFMERYKIRRGIIISKNTFDKFEFKEGEVEVVPITEFLMNLEKWLM